MITQRRHHSSDDVGIVRRHPFDRVWPTAASIFVSPVRTDRKPTAWSNASTVASSIPSAASPNAVSLTACLPRMPTETPSFLASSTTTIEPASNVSATWHRSKPSPIPRDQTPARGRLYIPMARGFVYLTVVLD